MTGWDRARWGMNASEIQVAYGAAMRQERKHWDFGGRKYYSDLTLTSTTIAGYDFTVHFMIDSSSDTLAAVQLAKDFDQDETGGKIAYERVNELLVQKYGRPTKEKQSEPRDRLRSFTSMWLGSNAQITLNYASIPLTGMCKINLTYEKPRDTDKL
jgi:hypothetical protein